MSSSASESAAAGRPAACPLCDGPGGAVIAATPRWRIVRAEDQPDFPLTYRVIWSAHVAEFTDLDLEERAACMAAVAAVEAAMRRHLHPDKINLAELGNVVPHLHWHVIARYRWDSRFPAPAWAPAVRTVEPARWQTLDGARAALETKLARLASA